MGDCKKCDRCGEHYAKVIGNRKLGKLYDTGGATKDQWDLCPDCWELFGSWIANDDSTLEKVVSGSEPCVTPESCRQYADQRKQGDDADCESCDSREKLEADVRKHYAYSTTTLMYPPSANKTTDMLRALPVDTVIGWLDRQAVITKRETLHDNPTCSGRSTYASKDEIRDVDIWNVAYEIYCAGGYVDNGNEPNPPTDGIRELLDRQAAITQHEITERWAEHLHPIERKCGDLRRKVDELTAERDEIAELVGWHGEVDGNSGRPLLVPMVAAMCEGSEVAEKLQQEHSEPNPDCSAMLYKTFTGNMCSHYEPKDGVVAILREAARNLSDYHDAGEALRRLTDTLNVYHALETLADMVERDYVRRESIEEVMDNDRALVDENSMLARELLKLRAELEKATNNLNSANKDFENARAELTAERDKLKELNEYHALQYELASEDADRLQAQVDGLQSKLAEYEDRSMQYVSLTGGKFYTGTKALTERIAELTAELDAAKQQISQFDAPKSVETPENPASKCEISDFDDSRDKLEADVLHHVEDIRNKSGWTGVCANYGTVIEWLDRQAAITEREVEHDLMKSGRMAVEVERERIKKLTAERDKAREESAEMYSYLIKASDEREHYREKCSKMATIIHDALMVMDEGMA